MVRALALLFFFCAATAYANPWQQLNPELRKRVAPIMQELPSWAKDRFAAWYVKWYCVGSEPKRFEELPVAGCPDIKVLIPEFYYNTLMTLEQRVSFACAITKLVADFPEFPNRPAGVGMVKYSGKDTTIVFQAGEAGLEALKNEINADSRFSDVNGAGYDRVWGRRSKREGAELHFEDRGEESGTFAVHIDIANPGESYVAAARHLVVDLKYREQHYTPGMLVSLFDDGCGIGAEDLAAAATTVPEEARVRFESLRATRACTSPMASANGSETKAAVSGSNSRMATESSPSGGTANAETPLMPGQAAANAASPKESQASASGVAAAANSAPPGSSTSAPVPAANAPTSAASTPTSAEDSSRSTRRVPKPSRR